MSTLLDRCQELKNAFVLELPDGKPRADAVAAIDLAMANVRLVAIESEKADADARAGADIDTLHPTVKAAWLGVVRAEKNAAEEARVEAERVAAEEAAAAEAKRVDAERLAAAAAAAAEAAKG